MRRDGKVDVDSRLGLTLHHGTTRILLLNSLEGPMKTKRFAFPALITAVLASACCLIPLLAGVLGISVGALGAFALFEKYRLVLAGLTLALLVIAFYQAYRGEEVCGPNGACLVEPKA